MVIRTDSGSVPQLFLEHAPAAIAMLDRDLRYLAASRRWLTACRVGNQDIIGRRHDDLVPEIPQHWKDVMRRCLGGSVEQGDADPFPRADGSVAWVRWECRPWREATGDIGGVIIFVDLISERRPGGDARVPAEGRYRAFVEQSVEGIFCTTTDGRYLMANVALAHILGFDTPQRLMAERPDLARDHYVHEHERARFRRLIDARGTVHGFEYEAYRRDGTVIWLREHARRAHDPDGTAYYEGTVEDVTKRRRDEEMRAHLLARAISAQEEERTRVARELHDETGQALSAILVGLRTVEEADTLEHARVLAQRLRDLTSQTIVDVGRIARGLRPSTLDDLGLIPALQRYADELSAARGIDIIISDDGVGRFGHEIETTLYRIIQEALTNVARHAGARQAHVTIERHPGGVRAAIRDDGDGFDVNETRGALGLIGMQERASLLGGSVHIASHPGAGATVSVELPLPTTVR
ncbi:MAG TPA: PAS domain S-box protein [Gemmatimonadales bacterium]|nr:PAS domain S-box protein [Gemmatimonadales bacterium]